ncbi:MAG: twin-arginine translocase subunit TatC [Thermomicrobiales bacterium]
MARTIKVPAWKFKIPRLPSVDPNTPDVFDEMTLQEHLVELRDRIMKICIGIGLSFVVGAFSARFLLEQIVKDAQVEGAGLDISAPTDPLTLYFKVALYIAIAISMPLIVYQLIAFLAPGLTSKEKRIVFGSLPFVTILFVAGVSYAYFVAAPRALMFLSGFFSGIFSWDPDGSEVLSFFLTLMIGLGLAFQLPVIMFVLAKIGIVSPKKMREWRRYAYLCLVILSAVITPSTDPINMAIVAIPLVILYEAGVIISSIFAKTGLRNADDDTALAKG